MLRLRGHNLARGHWVRRWRAGGAALLLVTGLVAAPSTVHGQSRPASQPASSDDQRTPPAATNADSELAQRLQRYRAIIENPADTESTRLAQAEEMILTGSAVDTAVALLSTGDEPTTKVIICRAISSVGQKRPELLEPRLIKPLLDLLGSSSRAVAAAAGEALAAFPNGQATQALSVVAADTAAPLNQRLAAVGALLSNADRRSVVAELIRLLDLQEPAITGTVITGLVRCSPVDYGSDAGAWQQWWARQETLSDTEWLQQQGRCLLQKVRQNEQRLLQFREHADRERLRLAGRIKELLADVLRLTAETQKRDEALAAWLAEPAVEFRLAAVSLVAEQISEGQVPADAVRRSLRERFGDESGEIRKLTIEVIGALNDPADAEAVLARLTVEREEPVRAAVLRTLGRLRNQTAVAPLLAELQREGVTETCLAAAAESLGTLATSGALSAEDTAGMVVPLKERFAGVPAAYRKGRVALLGAMAAIGSQEFAPEFEANLHGDDADLLLGAIQGVAVLKDASRVDRLVDLLTHADARVRQRALEALGGLGGPAQLPAILTRLDARAEPVDGPRTAAWAAFNQICRRLSLSEQVSAVERLAAQPVLATDYLKGLHDRLATIKPDPPELGTVRERLAALYDSQERYAEALPYWSQLHAGALQAHDPAAPRFGLALLNSALAGGRVDLLDTVLADLAGADESYRHTAATQLQEFLEKHRGPTPDAVRDALLSKLRALPADAFPALSAYLRSAFPAGTGEQDTKTTTPP